MESTEKNEAIFSVIIATYRSSYRDLLLSVESVIRQDFGNYELIICDDGSEYCYFSNLEEYFEQKRFRRYHLIRQDKNVGTVKNVIAALNIAKGMYVKILGAGDWLYSRKTLMHMYQFLEKKQCRFAFGRVRKYVRAEGKIHIGDLLKAPRKLGLYYHSNIVNTWLQKVNIAVCGDCIYGISMFGRRDGFLQYISELKDISFYAEDIAQLLIYLDGGRFHYLNETICWYESGDGVSQEGNIKTARAVNQDIRRTFQYALEKYAGRGGNRWMLDIYVNSYGYTFECDLILNKIGGFLNTIHRIAGKLKERQCR